jgi:two-component system, chemotaxis family, protein-glutamate methylesterase/glutaminase
MRCTSMARRNIVVIGASAGGIAPLQALVSRLQPGFPAVLCAVVHGASAVRPHLPETIAAHTRLEVRFPNHRERMRNGILLLAPPDRHLVIKESEVLLTRGPRENLWRPSVDVLFRTAAVAHSSRVIGVVLSGALDDGTAGAAAICACGGAVLVQQPEESEVPDMPLSVLRNLDGIRVVKAAELPDALLQIVGTDAPAHAVPETLRIEAGFAEDPMPPEDEYSKLGELSQNTCPECGGPLREAAGDLLRFRCRTGHAFSAHVLEELTRKDIESSLWSAIRLFQQRANIDRGLAHKESKNGRLHGADQYAMRAAEAQGHASVLHDLLMRLPD